VKCFTENELWKISAEGLIAWKLSATGTSKKKTPKKMRPAKKIFRDFIDGECDNSKYEKNK
jgi:hypothetical protein